MLLCMVELLIPAAGGLCNDEGRWQRKKSEHLSFFNFCWQEHSTVAGAKTVKWWKVVQELYSEIMQIIDCTMSVTWRQISSTSRTSDTDLTSTKPLTLFSRNWKNFRPLQLWRRAAATGANIQRYPTFRYQMWTSHQYAASGTKCELIFSLYSLGIHRSLSEWLNLTLTSNFGSGYRGIISIFFCTTLTSVFAINTRIKTQHQTRI